MSFYPVKRYPLYGEFVAPKTVMPIYFTKPNNIENHPNNARTFKICPSAIIFELGVDF